MIASTLTCRGNDPITIVVLGQGRLDPPVTLQPGQYLIILGREQAVAMEGDCAVGERSQLIEDETW